MFEAAGPTVAPVGSQNNEVGVPLTACRVDDDTAYLISEMGARGVRHIAWPPPLVGLGGPEDVCGGEGRVVPEKPGARRWSAGPEWVLSPSVSERARAGRPPHFLLLALFGG